MCQERSIGQQRRGRVYCLLVENTQINEFTIFNILKNLWRKRKEIHLCLLKVKHMKPETFLCFPTGSPLKWDSLVITQSIFSSL